MRNLDIFDFDPFDRYAPRLRNLINDRLNSIIDFVPFLQDIIEAILSDNIAQRREGNLVDRYLIIFDPINRFRRIDDSVVKYGINPNGDAIGGNGFLRLNINGFGPNIDLDFLIHQRHHPIQSRSFDRMVATEPKDNSALVFPIDFDPFRCKKTDR